MAKKNNGQKNLQDAKAFFLSKKRQTLLSTIDYYLLRRYLFMLSSPTNSRGSCEYIYS